ncbi:MAG: hypothetical protein E6H96_01360 [Chloroflexi bacterium]|nr:MAG: hypothetical protein E6H96_01360 [Chloroflexota bacterium]
MAVVVVLLAARPYPAGPLPLAPGVALAASPSPSPNGGDTRSAGEGPGLVGRPLQAVLGVIGLAGLTVLLTLSYVRLSDRGRRSRPPG